MPVGEARGFHRDASLSGVHLTLDRPPANVLDIPALVELCEVVRGISADAPVLVVSGHPHFCAGVAIGDHAPEKTDAMLAAIHGLLTALLTTRAITIAAMEGACLGGGAEIALCCDLTVAAEDAKIGYPEITLACFPPAAALLLPPAIGSARAMDLLLSGRVVSGREAERLGVVSRVVSAGQAAALAGELAAEIAGRSRPAVEALRTLVRAPRLRAFEERRSESEAAYRNLLRSPDLGRAVEAFLAVKSAKKFSG